MNVLDTHESQFRITVSDGREPGRNICEQTVSRSNRRQTVFARIVASVFLLAFALAPHGANAEPKLIWEQEGFEGPESIVKDADANVLYLSNVNGGSTDHNGEGYISKLSPDGEIVEKEWVTGLDAPKGLALHDGKLYVADIDKVAVIDVKDGKVVETHEAPGSSFLNDVTAHKDGRVFISDMLENHIWLLEDGKLSLWLEGEALDHPNGVLAEDDRLLIATWGSPIKDDFTTEKPGTLKSVDYGSKKVETLVDEPFGNLDGLEADGKGGYLITDWINGGLYRVAPGGKAELVMDLDKGSADHLVLEDGSVAIIPMMLDGKVTAYRLK